MYRDLIESFNKYFNHVEQIKKFELLPHEWSIDTGEMTPKLSMKRKVITEKYKDAIERIYSWYSGQVFVAVIIYDEYERNITDYKYPTDDIYHEL